MKENIISFPVAKLAKEKGFDEPCIDTYKDVELYKHKAKRYNSSFNTEWREELIKNSAMSNAKIARYSAPTQSLLQKWLRDVHNLYPFAWCNASGWGWELEKTNGTHISIMDIDGDVEGTEPESGMFKSYEEALEAGLQEALKLIKL